MNTTGFVFLCLKRNARDVWYNISDVPYCFSPAFSEHHAGIRMNKLRILDKTKATCGLVPSTKVLFVH